MNKISVESILQIIISFFFHRIHADECDRLWVLDTGTIGIDETTVQACPYTLNVFDLKTDKLLRQYRLRSEDINQVKQLLFCLMCFFFIPLINFCIL